MSSSLRVINNRYIIGGGWAAEARGKGGRAAAGLERDADGDAREGRSSSPSRGKRVEKEAAWGGEDGRREKGWKGFRFTQVY